MVNTLSQSQLARRLGISTAMVSKLHARGMPLDEAGARAWRRQHLSPFRGKHDRIGGNSGLPRGQRLAPLYSAAELTELAEDIAEAMCDDDRPHLFDEGLPHLMTVLGNLARLDEAAIGRVRLPLRCAAAVRECLGAKVND